MKVDTAQARRRGLGVRRGVKLGVAYAAILLALVALSSPRQTGDAHDYVALAHNLSHLNAPTFPADLRDVRAYFDRWGTGYEQIPPFFLVPDNKGDDGRYDLQHFWFYPALVAPALAVTDAANLHPNYAFSLVNVLLLSIAAAIVATQLGWALTALLFLGPILWWVDKAQTEAFTFSMLAIAMASLRQRPGLALVCLGAAATQNPPFAFLLALVAVAAVVARPARLRERGFLAGAALGGALALLYPLYYEVRLGRLSSLHGVHGHVPTLAELRFPVLDLNFGLLPDAPVIPLVLLGALIVLLRRRPRALAEWDVLVALAALPLFLYAFSQSPALAAGGTPSMTRYALWLIPLAIPVLARLHENRSVPGSWLLVAAAASAAWSVASFLPSRSAEGLLRPTRAASWAWRHHPGLENPLAEVFTTKVTHTFSSPQPSALPSCAKVLVVYGEWARCPVGPVPARCRADPCYANRSGGHYEFADAPLRGGTGLPPPDRALGFLLARRRVDAQLGAGSIRVPGRELTIVPGRLRGSIDDSRVLGHTARFKGWAADPREHRPARAVLVFADGRALVLAPPTDVQPDVAHAFGAGTERSGFSVTLPLDVVQSPTRRRDVRFFALGDRVASELPYACGESAVQDFGC